MSEVLVSLAFMFGSLNDLAKEEHVFVLPVTMEATMHMCLLCGICNQGVGQQLGCEHASSRLPFEDQCNCHPHYPLCAHCYVSI